MERADFIHLVRLSEHASAEDSVRYRRGVALFAALGYLWVIACLVLALAVFAWALGSVVHGRFHVGRLWALAFGAGLFWVTLRALWVRFDAPDGMRLERADAPGLFEALDRIRHKIGGPPIHEVYVDDQFNASIRQTPRYGIFGGAVNCLCVGLPLLMALDRRRVLSVLAHEYGHLRGNHGRLSAWIYRTRLSWLKLDASLQRDEGVMALASQAFFRWYFPRFAARTFALARQDEYEADRISSWLLGSKVAAYALTEIAIKGQWYADHFWAEHWARAAKDDVVVGPFVALRERMAGAPAPAFASQALRNVLSRVSDIDDTHPALRDRLEAFDRRPELPSWSAKSALHLLADPERWIAHFDRQWCLRHAEDWKQHRAWLGRIRERVAVLAAGAARHSADEMVEWADLERRLDRNAPVRDRYERALALTPNHAGALRGLIQLLPVHDREGGLRLLEELHAADAPSRWWAAQHAVGLLENPDGGPHDAIALKHWRARRKDAEDAETRAWEEVVDTQYFSQIARHDLSDFELGELRADFVRCKPIQTAWVVRKNLREFPWRRCYIVFLQLPEEMDDSDRYDLCRSLERTASLPGTALVLWAGHSPTLDEIERQAFEPVWARGL
ncbi:M48 family metallopeptidase [Variovorax sp. dw_954]|uniref:M48 family metallopeptidase n=1 Tax=unclassified Variovorax TaxID=663243 RepID=UPI001BD30882